MTDKENSTNVPVRARKAGGNGRGNKKLKITEPETKIENDKNVVNLHK